jgi:hypothetical protein
LRAVWDAPSLICTSVSPGRQPGRQIRHAPCMRCWAQVLGTDDRAHAWLATAGELHVSSPHAGVLAARCLFVLDEGTPCNHSETPAGLTMCARVRVPSALPRWRGRLGTRRAAMTCSDYASGRPLELAGSRQDARALPADIGATVDPWTVLGSAVRTRGRFSFSVASFQHDCAVVLGTPRVCKETGQVHDYSKAVGRRAESRFASPTGDPSNQSQRSFHPLQAIPVTKPQTGGVGVVGQR